MNETKKARFNFIDAIIILVILAVIGSAVYFIVFGNHANRSANMGNIDMVVRLSGVDEDALPFIYIGATVKDSVSGEVIGTVRYVRTEKTRYYGSNAIKNKDGTYTLPESQYPDRYDVYVTLSGNATQNNHGIYMIGNTKILIGSAIYFKVPSFTSVAYITEIYTQ